MEDVYRTTDRENRHDINGQEHLNPTPMQPPVGYKAQPSLIETIREQVRAYHLLQNSEEVDTEEEADDFDIPDDPIDPESKWENDHIPTLKEARERLSQLEELEKSYLSQSDRKDITANAPGAGPPEKGPAQVSAFAPGEAPFTSASE